MPLMAIEKIPWQDMLSALDPDGLLAPFDPHLAGTPPLGLDLPESDIDILLTIRDEAQYCAQIHQLFGACADFRLWQWIGGNRPVMCRFFAFGWEVELFASREPVRQQAGYRHFVLEQRLLALGGEAFFNEIFALRQAGLKTEPAFARRLGIDGDPYLGLLSLETADDRRLLALIERGRHSRTGPA